MANTLQKELKGLGLKDNKIGAIGFIVDDMSPGQISYTLVNNINKYVSETVALCVNVFCIDWLAINLSVKFPVFHIKDVYAFKGSLILTSKSAFLCCRDAYVPKKYFYVSDLSWSSDKEFIETLRKSDVPIIARCKDYADFLLTIGINCRYIVRDLDISELLQVINAEETKA